MFNKSEPGILMMFCFLKHWEALLSKSAESVVEAVIRRDPHEGEYVQAVQEVVHSLEPVLSKYPQYALYTILDYDFVFLL